MTGERLKSIFDNKKTSTSTKNADSSNNFDTTKGGAQKVKFTPSVPSSRNKKEGPTIPEKEETDKPSNSGVRRPNRKQPVPNAPPQEVRGIFSEGISTLGGRKPAPTSLSSIIGGKNNYNNGGSGGGRKGVDMTMTCVEPDSVDSAVDMRDMFSAITALHSPTIIDSDRFVIQESDLEFVQLPPEGEYFLLQIPHKINNNNGSKNEEEELDDYSVADGGSIRMHKSGKTSLVIGDLEYQVNPIVINLADTHKLVSVEDEVAYDLGSVHPKKLTASIKL